jgi:hypothetical protein
MRSKLHRLDAQLRPKFVDTGTPDHAQVTDMLAELICCGLGDRRSIIRPMDGNEIIDAAGKQMPEDSNIVSTLRNQANVAELAGKHLLSLSFMKGERHDGAVKRGNSLLMEAAALRQQADGTETRK